MKKPIDKYIVLLFLIVSTLNAQTPLTNTFTYQGELKFNNALASGVYDFQFSLFDAVTAGNFLGVVDAQDVSVNNGFFSTSITFSNDVFTGNQLWLSIAVRDGASTGAFDLMSPRQEITSSPYAIHAQFVGVDAVSEPEIVDGSVTNVDLATNAVTTDKIFPRTIASSDIAINAITTTELGPDAVGSSNIATAAVGSSELANSSVDSVKIVDGSIDTVDVKDAAISNAKLAFEAVDANEIKTDAVRLFDIDGTESRVYKVNQWCEFVNGLSTTTQCASRACSETVIAGTTIVRQYYDCNGVCGLPSPAVCNNSLKGFLLAPNIRFN